MDFFSVLRLACGLSLFLFGMNIMGEALEKQAGGRFKQVLERITSNPMSGVMLGTAVTAVIQSSSATTVMVVGLVNSGMMTLENSVGVIMGANIGTAMTAWLISLGAIESTNFFLMMLKPVNFSAIFAAIGIYIIMFSKNEKRKTFANILLGFTILMTGMEMMSAAVKPLADVPEFTRLLSYFRNPVLGVLTGTIVTAVIQSSSASVGILQAMSMTGSISFGSAVPIIMGQNIGTCITAIISCAGTSANAKRAALVHLYFNVLGVCVFLPVFYLIQATIGLSFIDDPVNPISIAVIHTVFKIFNTLLFLPFRTLLVRLAVMSVKDEPVDQKFQLLDDRFLLTPSFAVAQSKTLTEDMANLSRRTLFDAMEIVTEYSTSAFNDIMEREDDIDKYEDRIGSYLVKVSEHGISQEDSLEISKILHCIGDFERIGDHAVNIAQSAEEMDRKTLEFSGAAKGDLQVMGAAVREIVDMAVTCFANSDSELAKRVEPLEEVIDMLKVQLKDRHIARLQRGECTTLLGFLFSDIISDYERVADHCSNIAISVIQETLKGMVPHEYLSALKIEEDKILSAYYAGYLEKYKL